MYHKVNYSNIFEEYIYTFCQGKFSNCEIFFNNWSPSSYLVNPRFDSWKQDLQNAWGNASLENFLLRSGFIDTPFLLQVLLLVYICYSGISQVQYHQFIQIPKSFWVWKFKTRRKLLFFIRKFYQLEASIRNLWKWVFWKTIFKKLVYKFYKKYLTIIYCFWSHFHFLQLKMIHR